MTVISDEPAPIGGLDQPSATGDGRRILRRRFALLAVMALLPLTVIATLWVLDAVQRERARLEEVAVKLAADIVVRLDTELAGHIRAAEIMAALPIFDGEDPAEAQEMLGRALGAEPLWQNLFVLGPDARQVVNAARPGELRRSPVPESVASVFETGRAKVTDVAVGTGAPAVALQVPIERNGAVAYVLSAVLDPAPLAELFRRFLPPGWKAVAIDRQGHIVVRTSDGATRTGELASEGARGAVQRGEAGRLRHSSSIDGDEHVAVYLQSPLTGWSVHSAIPQQELSPLQSKGIGFVAAGALTSGFLAGLLGFMLVRDLRAEHRRQAALQRA